VSFIISTSVNSSVEQIRVCERCATDCGQDSVRFSAPDMEHATPDMRRGSETADRECVQCHSSFRFHSRSTLLGCPVCYAEFARTLRPFLRRIHGSVIHRGKAAPAQAARIGAKAKAGDRGTGSPRTREVASWPRLRVFTDLSSLYGRPGASFPALASAKAEWMEGDGPDCDVVISTRARLARNILGYAFPNKLVACGSCDPAGESELQHIAEIVEDAVADIARTQDSFLRNASVIKLKHLDAIDREFLIERHLISRDLVERAERKRNNRTTGFPAFRLSGSPEVIVGEKEVASIMVNEEDHIRLQVVYPGLQVRESWEMINAIDDALSRKIDYAFSPDWGYLTACPTNVGTGLRVSVMLHIPALAAMAKGQQEKQPLRLSAFPSLLNSISDMGYAVRGIYGEGSLPIGAFYQISNEATLGQSEVEIVERIRSVVRQIVDRERDARCSMLDDPRSRSPRTRGGASRIEIEDKIFRSYGTLMNARLISSSEALDLLSWVSLGVNIGVLSEPSRTDIARLLVLTRPAHLQKYEGRELDAAARDISRAAAIRKVLMGGGFDF
jgi:protein arginine kinase